MNWRVRTERLKDYPIIHDINTLAFQQSDEGKLISALRKRREFLPGLSLVAELDNGDIVGHILFSPITIESEKGSWPALALAPMAVHPDFQEKGIGKSLVEKGLLRAAALGFTSVVVLGHKSYYPQFGFYPASKHQITPPFDVPDEAFMILPLRENALDEVQGTVVYPKEFDSVS